MRKIASSIFFVVLGSVLPLLLISCSQGPSKNQAKAAINSCMKSDRALGRTLIEEARFGYSALPKRIDSIDIQKVGNLNKNGNYYNVSARVKGIAVVTPPLSFSSPESEYTKSFDKVVWFRLWPEVAANARRSGTWFADTDHVENLSSEYLSQVRQNSPINVDGLVKAFQGENWRKAESQMNSLGKQMKWEYYTKPLIAKIIIWALIGCIISGAVGIIVYYLNRIAKKDERVLVERGKTSENIPSMNIPEQIKQLAELRDKGILTETEFEQKKKELLSKI